jgi:hypothetical protein
MACAAKIPDTKPISTMKINNGPVEDINTILRKMDKLSKENRAC